MPARSRQAQRLSSPIRPQAPPHLPASGAMPDRWWPAKPMPTAAGMIPATPAAVSSRSPAAPAMRRCRRRASACAWPAPARLSPAISPLPAAPASPAAASSTGPRAAASPIPAVCPSTSAPTPASAAAQAVTASRPTAAAPSSGSSRSPARPIATAGSARIRDHIPSAGPRPCAVATSSRAPAMARSGQAAQPPASARWDFATSASRRRQATGSDPRTQCPRCRRLARQRSADGHARPRPRCSLSARHRRCAAR